MKRKSIALLSLVLVLMLLLSACSALNDAAELTEYDFDTDKIPSVNAVIGAERKVTGVSTGTSNGLRYKEYTYESGSVTEDLIAYAEYMMGNNWIPIKDFNLNNSPGEMQLANESADAGTILVITITYQSDGYIVLVEKAEGTLTRD